MYLIHSFWLAAVIWAVTMATSPAALAGSPLPMSLASVSARALPICSAEAWQTKRLRVFAAVSASHVMTLTPLVCAAAMAGPSTAGLLAEMAMTLAPLRVH